MSPKLEGFLRLLAQRHGKFLQAWSVALPSAAELEERYGARVDNVNPAGDALQPDDVDALSSTIIRGCGRHDGVDLVLGGVSLDLETQVAGLGNAFTEPHFREEFVIQVRLALLGWLLCVAAWRGVDSTSFSPPPTPQ